MSLKCENFHVMTARSQITLSCSCLRKVTRLRKVTDAIFLEDISRPHRNKVLCPLAQAKYSSVLGTSFMAICLKTAAIYAIKMALLR